MSDGGFSSFSSFWILSFWMIASLTFGWIGVLCLCSSLYGVLLLCNNLCAIIVLHHMEKGSRGRIK